MNRFKSQTKSLNKINHSLSKPIFHPIHKSSSILAHKLLDQLSEYDDDDNVSLLTSIPILHSGDIVQVIKSIEQVEQLLSEDWKCHETRLRNEAKFIYHLWRVIAEEQIKTLKMKQIIYLFHEKKGNQLKAIMRQMFGQSEDLNKLYSIWNHLSSDMMYYREWNRKKTTQIDKNISKINEESFTTQKFNMTTNFQLIASKSRQTKCKSKGDKKRMKTDYGTSQFTIQNKENRKFDTIKIEKQYADKRVKTQYPIQKNTQTFNRLYNKQFYRKREVLKQHQQQKQRQEQMKECTFKPKIYESRIRSNSKTSLRSESSQRKISIRGYQKSVNRLKDGYLKQIQRKKMMEYISTGQNYEKLKRKAINPPTFLQRQRKQQQILLSIGFEINNRKTVVKLRRKDTAQSASRKICQIYGLNPKKYQQQIEQIITQQIKNQLGSD